ncbi:hypothetical protein DDL62_05635, partial [Neisseria gonorrhoeae]
QGTQNPPPQGVSVRVRPWAPQPLLERLFFCLLLFNEIDKTKYSGLNLNRYGVASPCRTICTVCGFVVLS